MTYATFEKVFLASYPGGSVSAHKKGEYSRALVRAVSTQHVYVTFEPNGRTFKYSGTYREILEKTHCDFAFRSEIERLKKRIAELEESGETPNPYLAFLQTRADYKPEIESCQEELAAMEASKMILEE